MPAPLWSWSLYYPVRSPAPRLDPIARENLRIYNAAHYQLSVFYDLPKVAATRLTFSQGHELTPFGGNGGPITPGWLPSEMMLNHYPVSEENWRDALIFAGSSRRTWRKPRRVSLDSVIVTIQVHKCLEDLVRRERAIRIMALDPVWSSVRRDHQVLGNFLRAALRLLEDCRLPIS